MKSCKNLETISRICGNFGTKTFFFFFGLHLFSFDPHTNKPRASFEFTSINFSCPPNLFLLPPPQSSYPGAGPVKYLCRSMNLYTLVFTVLFHGLKYKVCFAYKVRVSLYYVKIRFRLNKTCPSLFKLSRNLRITKNLTA